MRRLLLFLLPALAVAQPAPTPSRPTYCNPLNLEPGEYFQTDLGSVCTVRAVQINYADQDVNPAFLGWQPELYHQHRLYHLLDGKAWQLLVDKSRNKTDVPHGCLALKTPLRTRYLKLENGHMPTGKFALSGLRVFGLGSGPQPPAAKDFVVLRTATDKRSAWLKWAPVDAATGYNIYIGLAPDQLYSCAMVQGANDYYFKGMDKGRTYYFTIEAFNENGCSARTSVQKAE